MYAYRTIEFFINEYTGNWSFRYYQDEWNENIFSLGRRYEEPTLGM